MSSSLFLTGYDLSDEGPCRTVNEDATLVREDLGLFAVSDGAGGRGLGDVAANLTLRSVENYIGATVRRSHEKADYDRLGTPEQALRLSSAIHQAHQNILQIAGEDEARAGMASTVVALLLAPRTKQAHIGHVGNSRCYRLRHGRLELLTADHTIATEILERRPNTADRVLANLPRNSVVKALGMNQEFRVTMRSVDLLPGDRFVLCTDGLTSAVETATIWLTTRELDTPAVIASELLGHALAARAQDNISILVADCHEQPLSDELETQRYNEIPDAPDDADETKIANSGAASPSSDDEAGLLLDGLPREAIERVSSHSELPPPDQEPQPEAEKEHWLTEVEEQAPPSSTPYALDELDLELDDFSMPDPPAAEKDELEEDLSELSSRRPDLDAALKDREKTEEK